MGIIQGQDQRPRDWAYQVAFKEKDLPSLQEMVKHIRETHDVDMIEDFNRKCEQKLSTGAAVLDNGIEIEAVAKTGDLVTNPGLQQCINIILGTSATRWSHIQASRNNVAATPTVNDTALNIITGGPYVIPLTTYGWKEPKGMKLFFGTIVHQDATTGVSVSTINEMGVFNTATPNGATMLNRENFFNNQLVRNIVTPDLIVYANVFILSCVIEFCPVA